LLSVVRLGRMARLDVIASALGASAVLLAGAGCGPTMTAVGSSGDAHYVLEENGRVLPTELLADIADQVKLR